MADIEERAEKWAREHERDFDSYCLYSQRIAALTAAYLAGSAQTQADYVAHFYRD